MAGQFERLMQRANADERVVGVTVGGSRGRAVETVHSDWDVYILVRDEHDVDAVTAVFADISDPVELCAVLPLGVFSSVGGVPDWNRYTFAHVQPVLDRTGGTLQQLCDAKELLDESTASGRAALNLEGYVNSCYRSLKNHRDGNAPAARLDAAESINYLLEFVFADARRVRPYNKYLQWELKSHPLPATWWTEDEALEALTAIIETGAPTSQSALFRVIEPQARATGHGAQLDNWGQRTLTLLRGR